MDQSPGVRPVAPQDEDAGQGAHREVGSEGFEAKRVDLPRSGWHRGSGHRQGGFGRRPGAGAPGLTRLGVVVSGRGTNLAAILEACAAGGIPGEVVFVASNKPGCPALEIARQAKVPEVQAFPLTEYADLATRDAAMAAALKSAGVELVITAGYDRVLDEGLVSAFD